jgi:hypothetical protein
MVILPVSCEGRVESGGRDFGPRLRAGARCVPVHDSRIAVPCTTLGPDMSSGPWSVLLLLLTEVSPDYTAPNLNERAI